MESNGRREGEVGDESLGLGRDSWLKAEEGWGEGPPAKMSGGMGSPREERTKSQHRGEESSYL